MLFVISLIRITVITLAVFIHDTAMSTFVLHQIAFVSKVLFTKGLLALVLSGFTVANHVMFKLAPKRKVCLTYAAFELAVLMVVLV